MVPVAELDTLVRRGELNDARTIAAVRLALG
jgi:hypothetical protein